MTQQPPLNDEDRDDLIAYLDGELDRNAATELEGKIQRDPQVRAEANLLRKTWELLDHLPRPQPSSNFTNRTLERLAAQKAAPSARWPVRWRSVVLGVGWAAAVLVASAVGFGAGHWLPHPAPAPPILNAEQLEEQESLIRDLRVIENKRLYEHADDLEFVRDLADVNDPDLFGEDNLGS